MKVLGILATPHVKGNTVLLLEAALAGAAGAGAETEKITLAGLSLEFCVACSKCHATGECIYEDDAEAIKTKMDAADGIILGAPNYINCVPAQLKVLMDRCSQQIHLRRWLGKYGAAVATAGGSEEERVAAYENEFLRACGAQTVGTATALGAGVGVLQDQEAALARAQALGADLVAAINEQRQYPDQLAQIAVLTARMKMLVTHMAEHAPYQYEYWQKRGWL
jgi:multimeric flavodoxin WrbA